MAPIVRAGLVMKSSFLRARARCQGAFPGLRAGSAEDLRGRLDAGVPAPGEIQRFLRRGRDGICDLAVFAQVLDRTYYRDVHHARPLADRAPGVDRARGLVHVAARADDLPGADDLPRAG